jgi:uncharacterized protein
MELLPRGLFQTVSEAWASAPVVVLEGLRATGKTTLARQISAPGSFRDLSQPDERERARRDTWGWVEALPKGTVIDEAQLVPDLQLAIKREVDRRSGGPGQFFLTGSARLNTSELGGSDPLVGRARRLRLHPFSQCEIDGQPLDVITALFEESPTDWAVAECPHDEVIQRASRGGFPFMFTARDGAPSPAMLTDYAAQLFNGDVYRTGKNTDQILRLFRWLTARSGTLRNFRQFADQTDLGRDTIADYLDALTHINLVEWVPGYRAAQDGRETERARVFVADPAFVAAVHGSRPDAIKADDDVFASLLETFVATELIRLAAWSPTGASIFHWREDNKREVDLVLERHDGGLVGIEVKAARNARQDHTRGLEAFRNRYPKRFLRGYVLHSGDHVTSLGHNLWGVPFSALWSIGEPLTPKPANLVDRFSDAIQSVVSADRSAHFRIHDDAQILDRAVDRATQTLERFASQLRDLSLTAEVIELGRFTWESGTPPSPREPSWWRAVQMRVTSPEAEPFVAQLRGTLTGQSVSWGLTMSHLPARGTTGVVGDNHTRQIDGLFEALIQAVPTIIGGRD